MDKGACILFCVSFTKTALKNSLHHTVNMLERVDSPGTFTWGILENIDNDTLLKDFITKSMDKYVDSEMLVFFDNVAAELVSGDGKICSILRKLSKKEKNPVERLFFSYLGGYKVKEAAFIYKLYFYFRYPELFRDAIFEYRHYTSPVETILNVLFLLKHEKIKIESKAIAKLLRSLDIENRCLMLARFYSYMEKTEYVSFFF